MADFWRLIVQSFESYWQTTVKDALAPRLLTLGAALVAAAITLMAARLVGRAVRRAVERASREAEVSLLVGRLSHLAVSLLGVGWVLTILGLPWAALAGFFGVLGVGLSLALQDVLKNLIAGLYLLVERPYRIGDIVWVKGFEGTVEDVRLRTTYLRMADGRMVVTPNVTMLTEVVIRNRKPPPP